MTRIGYDAQAFLSPEGATGKGMQLKTLLGPFADRFSGFASTDPNASGLPLVQEGLAGYTGWQQLSLPRLLKRHRIQLFLAPYNAAPFFLPRSVDLILVLHDTILLQGFRSDDRKSRFMDAYRRWQIPRSVLQARIVLTVSEHARGEILRLFPEANVRVIPCTLPRPWFRPMPLGGRDGYLLMTTSPAPHKNAEGGLTAYARYVHRVGAGGSRPLRVAGMGKHAAAYQKLLDHEGIAHRVTFLPFLSESELIAQYQGASALLLPSFAEGFGIPMLEAMATGTPVIASHAASLPEVGGSAARYFDPRNISEITEALVEVLGNDALRAEMARRGLIEVQRYAPEVVGEQVISFWQEVAGVCLKDRPQSPCPSATLSHSV